MRLKEIRISGFRSIAQHAEIHSAAGSKPGKKAGQQIMWHSAPFAFQLPIDNTENGHMMTAIMGPNSAGKSTILLALNLFFGNSNKLDAGYFHQQDTDTPVVIEATLAGAVDADPSWQARYCRAGKTGSEITLVSIWDKGGRRRLLRSQDGLYYKQSAADRTLCDRLMPAFRMIWADTRPGEAAELKRENLLSDLLARAFQQRNGESVAHKLQELLFALERLLARDDGSGPPTGVASDAPVDWSALDLLETQLSDGLAQLTPQRNRVRIRLDSALPSLEDVLARGVTVIDDGAALPFDQHGLGLQRAFAVSVLKAWCAHLTESTRDYVFAIEEPEIYLHPHATRIMLRILEQIAQRHQVLFTTHANEFVNRAPIQHVLMVSRRKQRNAWVSQVQRPHLRGLKAEEVAKVQRYLREDRSDMLFARAVLLVEGQAELFALPSFADTLGLDLDAAGVSVVFVNGIGNFGAYHQILRGFGIPHVILMDGDGKRSERLRAFAGMANVVIALAHDFERELVEALIPARRQGLARECQLRRGKAGGARIGSGARGAQDLARLGKPLVGRVAGEYCKPDEIRRMCAIVQALEQTVSLALGPALAQALDD